MPRLGCDTRIDKPSINVVDRVLDLGNRVKWLKNVEFCLLGDQTDRLTKIKGERHDMETLNNDLRKSLKRSEEKVNPFGKDINIVDGVEFVNNKHNRLAQQHNELLSIRQCLLHRLAALHDQAPSNQTSGKSAVSPTKEEESTRLVTRRIREIQDRMTSVSLINKTLNTCKQHLQCDLDLLRKELPNVQKDIGQKFDQRIILKKEFTDIVAENKRRLKTYQQLLAQTEAQSRQRRIIHEQAMASIAEQLEDQYQVQMIAVNDMATVFDSRRLTSTGGPTPNTNHSHSHSMSTDEIVQIRCMYDQFYNIAMAGLPIDIHHSKQLKEMSNEVSSKTMAMLTMTTRMMEEKEQINQQISRVNKLLKLSELSIDCKNDLRQKILSTMSEQRRKLELLCINDSIEEQNRIVRHINDFIIVLCKALCEHAGSQILAEPPIGFIERLEYISDLILKTVRTVAVGTTDEDDQQPSPIVRRGGGGVEEISQLLKESRSIDRSITSSMSSLSSRTKRNSTKANIY